MHNLVLLVLCGAAYAVAAPGAAGGRILGGQDATIEQYPFTAIVMNYRDEVWHPTCGGTLVTRTTIMSAASCYGFALPSWFSVRVGSTSRVTGGTVVAAREFVYHPDYEKLMVYISPPPFDLVILRVAPGIEYSDTIRPASIPAPLYPLPTGTEVTALGWGEINNNGSLTGPITENTETLRKLQVRVFDQQTCIDRYYQYYDIEDHMLCSMAVEDAGSCRGDKGGPLVLESTEGKVVVGIISWQHACGHEYFPEINTRISSFSDWIVENGSG